MMPNPLPAPPVGLLLLAAGASRRLGQPKQLLRYEGQTLLRRAAETALAVGCGPLVVVTGALHAELAAELAGLPAQLAHNPRWAAGMGTSVAAGLAALLQTHPPLGAAVVLVSDQPFLSAALLGQLVAAHRAGGAPLVAAAYGGTVGVPALFARQFFPELSQLSAEAGARALLRRHAPLVKTLPWPDGLLDIDTLADYQRLLDALPPPPAAGAPAAG